MKKKIVLLVSLLQIISSASIVAGATRRLVTTWTPKLARTAATFVVRKAQDDPKSAAGAFVGGVVAYNFTDGQVGLLSTTKNVLLGMGVGYVATKKSQSITQHLKDLKESLKEVHGELRGFRYETKRAFDNVAVREQEMQRMLVKIDNDVSGLKVTTERDFAELKTSNEQLLQSTQKDSQRILTNIDNVLNSVTTGRRF